MKRSYISLQEKLHPDTIFFLGDLFDGGREWKTAHGNTKDPSWANGLRPSGEQAFVETWGKRYGEDFWLHEYDRFGRIFYKFWNLAGANAGPWQRGRKIISTLPGNHDLGFGAQIKIPIRNRFEVYFGEGNRVDVIGNHTFVSVDSVSLSAGGDEHGTKEITDPVEKFLANVQVTKRKAVARELSFLSGREAIVPQKHQVEDLERADFKNLPTLDPGPGAVELPTILLTHVPLYRAPGTPCGPKREHWPPATPPNGQTTPVFPDDRNAISISRGYQYQNVLSESDSVKLTSMIGNVVSVYSGDDHDYCEIVHPENKNHAREITVKSTSWAMGVRKPGFLLLSMWNPIGSDGSSLYATPTGVVPTTTQSHLCLLPDQLGIFIRYAFLIAITILTLLIRAILTPILHLTPFSSLSAQRSSDGDDTLLPSSKRREEDSTSSTSSNHFSSAPVLAPRSAAARTRSVSPANGYGLPLSQARFATPPLINSAGYNSSYIPPSFDDDSNSNGKTKGFNGSAAYNSGKPKPSTPDTAVKLVFREAWQSVWRVTWMAVLIYCYLAYFG
jgi:hypothetical protein